MAQGPNPPHAPAAGTGVHPMQDEIDPAHQSLAEALRQSFRVLKVLMLVLVVLYFLSGWFSVKSHERGVIMRYGNIVGAGGEASQQGVLGPGWHWSWPFPIDRWQTISVNERELPLKFMLALDDQERATGVIGRKYNPLAPERDDYLVTGDVNILHASLTIRYKITNVIDYITNVHPMPSPKATVRSPAYEHYPEYTVLRNLARDAVIETAAKQVALDIRGNKQDAFLLSVAKTLNRKLNELAERGAPLGITIDPNAGVFAPKGETGRLEAIMPPRQTQEVFDKVFTAQTNKSVAITKARSDAEALLVNTAGPNYQALADAIDDEFNLIRQVAAARRASETTGTGEDLAPLTAALAEQRNATEARLASVAGQVRSIIKNAEIRRDRIIKEATGDYERFMAVLPEYLRNPNTFLSRMRDEARARALADQGVTKVYVPPGAQQYRLHIPREGRVGSPKEEPAEPSRSSSGGFSRELRAP